VLVRWGSRSYKKNKKRKEKSQGMNKFVEKTDHEGKKLEDVNLIISNSKRKQEQDHR